MAGSGMRGQSEEKFKALLRDIEELVLPALTRHGADKLFASSMKFPRSHIMAELH
jgi:hypothetical protein